MSIVPPELAAPPRISTREKWMIGGVLGVVAALAVVLVFSFMSSGPSSSHGCIYATVPAATGAEQIHQCGATARATCRSARAAYRAQAAQAIATECRKAGLPVG